MAHSRADIMRARAEFFTASDKVIDVNKALIEALKTLIDTTGAQITKIHGELAALENARRAVNMVMGEEEKPLELNNPVRSGIKDLAAKIAGNGS